jgi:RND family efflux transporter MFP subunit
MADDDLSQLKIDKTKVQYLPMKRRRILSWTAGIFLLVLLGILYIKGVFTPAVEVEAGNVIRVYPSQTFTLLNASGYVVAQRKAAVASKITGRLISLSVEEGNRVKAGQVIARLESDDVNAARDQAKANLDATRQNLAKAEAELDEAEASLNRNKELIAQGFVSRAEYDASEARYKKAVAAVAAAEAAIKAGMAALQSANVAVEYTVIRSPFDAVVLTKNADVGDIVTPIGAAADAKSAVVTVADMESLQVEVDVSESNLQMVKRGQPCEILLDALPHNRFRGAVHMIVPTADRTKATVMVKVSFIDKDSRILPEMSAKVAFLSREVGKDEQKLRTALDPSGIVTRNGRKIVYKIIENRAFERPIKTGVQLGDMVEVSDGVEAGDRIVLKPLNKMRNGLKIKVAER